MNGGLRELHLFAGAGMKTCGGCNRELDLDAFYSNKSQPDQRASQCKECARAYQKNKYDGNPEAQRERKRKYLANYSREHNERRRLNRREIYITESARRYGINPEDVRSLIATPKCQICNKSISFDSKNVHDRPNIDHCHSSGMVRGVLCGYCNNLLGRCNDSIEILRKAIEYLEEQGAKCGIS